MSVTEQLLQSISEPQTARAVGIRFDSARMRHPAIGPITGLPSFENAISDSYAYMFTTCVAPGARMPKYESCGRAKQIVTEEYRRHGLTYGNACDDAITGTNGGIRRIIDLICDTLKAESTALYIEHVFDSLVAPTDWDAKVSVIREILGHFQPILTQGGSATTRPEQYAHDYKKLVRVIVDAQRRVEQHTRRL